MLSPYSCMIVITFKKVNQSLSYDYRHGLFIWLWLLVFLFGLNIM